MNALILNCEDCDTKIVFLVSTYIFLNLLSIFMTNTCRFQLTDNYQIGHLMDFEGRIFGGMMPASLF